MGLLNNNPAPGVPPERQRHDPECRDPGCPVCADPTGPIVDWAPVPAAPGVPGVPPEALVAGQQAIAYITNTDMAGEIVRDILAAAAPVIAAAERERWAQAKIIGDKMAGHIAGEWPDGYSERDDADEWARLTGEAPSGQ